MPDGEAGENRAKDLSSLTEPPGWSWQESQQGLEGGAGPGGPLGWAGQVWAPILLGPSCTEVSGTPLSGLCLSLGRAGISWLNVPGAVIQYLGSKCYFYCVLFIQTLPSKSVFKPPHPREGSGFGYNCVVRYQP